MIPASIVPAGQMYLQKLGLSRIIGRRMAKNISIKYFIMVRFRVVSFFLILGVLILYTSSWISPKGQRKPQITLPKMTPKSIRRPRT